MQRASEGNIAAFFRYGADELGRVSEAPYADHRRVLLLVLIDTLAHIPSPGLGPGPRFVKLIQKYSDWEDRDRVSLPHLSRSVARQAAKSPSRPLASLASYVSAQLLTWDRLPPGSIVRAEMDAQLPDILRRVPSELHALVRLSIYPAILWGRRNLLVHESPAADLDFPSAGVSPFYVRQSRKILGGEGLDSKPDWVLTFPESLLHALVQACSDRVRRYCLTNRVDPYSRFEVLLV